MRIDVDRVAIQYFAEARGLSGAQAESEWKDVSPEIRANYIEMPAADVRMGVAPVNRAILSSPFNRTN
jgi:hypothetical protein